MKRVRFQELAVLSETERKARRITFHPRRNLLVGNNGTGKSSLVKSLFLALGAEPPQSDDWRSTEPIYFVELSVDGLTYRFLREGRKYTVFDSDNQIALKGTSVTNDLAPFIAMIFSFGLLLQGRSDPLETPTPAFYFLPSYIDQDAGWNRRMASFRNLAQFKSNPVREAILYHAGIRPNSYYENQKRLEQHRSSLDSLMAEKGGLESLLAGIEERMEHLDFSLDLTDYQEELDRLIKIARSLKQDQDKYKSKLTELESRKYELEVQLAVTKNAARELQDDYTFAVHRLEEGEVPCPTCGQVYSNGFAERFSIAEDTQSLLQLAADISEQLVETRSHIEKHQGDFDIASYRLEEVQSLLSVRKQEIELRQILESEGRRQVKSLLKEDMDVMRVRISELCDSIAAKEQEIEGLIDPERRKEIMDAYRELLGKYLYQLGVANAQPSRYSRIDWNVHLTGSQLPRGILAYFYSILQLGEMYGTCSQPPVVIDAPKQQELDSDNYAKVLDFIMKNTPAERQLILSVVDHDFDLASEECEVFHMKDDERALLADQYQEVSEYLEYYRSRSFFDYFE